MSKSTSETTTSKRTSIQSLQTSINTFSKFHVTQSTPNKLSHSASSSESVAYALPTLSLTTEEKNSSSTWSDVVIAAIPYREMQIACSLSHVTQHSSHKNRKPQKETEHPLPYPSTLLFTTYHLLSRKISPSSNPPPTAKNPSLVYQLYIAYKRNASLRDLHYYNCMNSRDFPCETDNTRRNRQNFNESERHIKNENQMKSSFLRGNLSPRKGKIS